MRKNPFLVLYRSQMWSNWQNLKEDSMLIYKFLSLVLKIEIKILPFYVMSQYESWGELNHTHRTECVNSIYFQSSHHELNNMMKYIKFIFPRGTMSSEIKNPKRFGKGSKKEKQNKVQSSTGLSIRLDEQNLERLWRLVIFCCKWS